MGTILFQTPVNNKPRSQATYLSHKKIPRQKTLGTSLVNYLIHIHVLLVQGVLLPMPENCPEWIYDIMLLCWKRDTEERVTFTEICRSFKDKNEDYDIPSKWLRYTK